MIDRAGDAWSWGMGGNGRTGLGHERVAVRPAGPLRRGALAGAPRLARARTAKEHSLVVAADGRLVGFGRSADGELPTRRLRARRRARVRRARPGVDSRAAARERRRRRRDRREGGGGGVRNRASRAMFRGESASAAIRAEDGRVYAWGAPRAWLGRGDDGDAWAPGGEPGPIRFPRASDAYVTRGDVERESNIPRNDSILSTVFETIETISRCPSISAGRRRPRPRRRRVPPRAGRDGVGDVRGVSFHVSPNFTGG